MNEANITISSTHLIDEELIEDQNRLDARRLPRNVQIQPREPPPYLQGVLTRTVTHSPITRYIFPASLWGRKHREAIFVGENYISIKAYVHDPSNSGHLEDVVTKSDFGARIMSAKVLGLPSNSTLEPEGSLPDEEDCLTATKGWPSHILCLALSTCELIFLSGDIRKGPQSTFTQARKPLPDNVSRLEQYGHHMAMDPLSRAMAISAAQDFFGIMTMRTYDEIKAEKDQTKLQPVKDERYFHVDGSILAMDFLFPPRRDPNLVILVLLVLRQQSLMHQTFAWNITQGLSMVSSSYKELITYPTGFYEPVPATPIPIMLIPVTLPASYLIATPTKAVIYRNVLSELPPVSNELAPPNSRWVSWARPQRTEKWVMQHDDVYVCSDDGQLLLISMSHEGNFTITPVDTIGTNLDTAFAVLDIGTGNQDGDVLVTAGGLGDGALITAPARSSIKIKQRLPNWGPVIDCLSLPAESSELRQSKTDYRSGLRRRLFVCTGNGENRGSLMELRHGLEAKVGLDLDYGEMYPRNLFIIPDPAGQAVYMLISQLVGSTFLRISTLSDDMCAIDGDECGLDLNENTLTAGITATNILTQVTHKEVNLTILDGTGQRLKHKPYLHILSAKVDAQRELAIVAGIKDAEKAVFVEVRKIVLQKGSPPLNGPASPELSEPVLGPEPLEDEPLSFLVEEVNHRQWLFVGTVNGKLICLSRMPDGNGIERNEFEVRSPVEKDVHAIESMQVLRADSNDDHFVLLCGLRCGWMVPYQVELNDGGSFSFLRLKEWRLGVTGVRLIGYEQDKSFAILSCGPGVWKFSWFRNVTNKAFFTIEPVYITDENNPAYKPPEIFASAMISISGDQGRSNESLNGCFVCCTFDHLLICDLSEIPKTVSRTIFLPGSPEKMIYSPRLNRIVVASLVQEKRLDKGHVFSWTRPQLDFIDPNTTNAFPFKVLSNETSHSIRGCEVPSMRGVAGEKVTALMEWTFRFAGMPYTFIALATQRPFAADRMTRARGCIHFLRAKFNQKYPEEVESVAKHRIAFDSPVRCFCPFEESGIVVCYGTRACIVLLDQSTRHFSPLPEFSLESEATSVSAQGCFIYIMTARSSLLVLRMDYSRYGEMRLVAQAGCDKAGLDHMLLREEKLVLSSHRGGGIVGYHTKEQWVPTDKHLPISFAATVFSSVRYFCEGPCPTAERPDPVYGVGIDGAVYSFTVLSRQEWLLLKFLQNLCMTDRDICPKQTAPVDFWQNLTIRRENLQIDGDTLAKLVDLGPEYLSQRVNSPLEDETEQSDSPVRRRHVRYRLIKRFLELTAPIFGEEHDCTDMCENVISWTTELVQVR